LRQEQKEDGPLLHADLRLSSGGENTPASFPVPIETALHEQTLDEKPGDQATLRNQ
jgi:hypothetical protein